MQTSIVVADGFELIRSGIIERLREYETMEVVGECSNGFEAVKVCSQRAPDILLSDVELEGIGGPQLFERIRARCPNTKIIVMASDTQKHSVASIFSFGVLGLVPRKSCASDIVMAVQSVSNGFGLLPTSALSDLVNSHSNVNKTGNVFGLSRRELEILDLCVSGKANKEVAVELGISVRTVETHRANIYKKTECVDLEALSQVAENLRAAR